VSITVYTSEHCPPCKRVTDLIKKGRLQDSEQIDLVDIETDEGFLKFKKEVLNHGDSAVPSAYRNKQQCVIRVDEENDLLIFDCPNTDDHSSIGKG